MGCCFSDVLCGSLTWVFFLAADASFHRNANEDDGVLGCDMACQAYIQVGVVGEEMEAVGGDSCVVQIRDVDSTRIPLRCAEGTRFPAAGTRLRLEIWFRDATLYSLGS